MRQTSNIINSPFVECSKDICSLQAMYIQQEANKVFNQILTADLFPPKFKQYGNKKSGYS